MDRPFGRHDGLLVVQPHHTALLWLTHDVADGLSIRQVEVIISLDAATMRVRRHRVPHTTLLQLCQAHLQLAGTFLQRGVHNQLIDSALVRLSQCAQRTRHRSLQRLNLAVLSAIQRHPLRLVVLMSSGRVNVELGRVLRVFRAEDDLLVRLNALAVLILAQIAASDVKRLLGSQRILLTIHNHHTVSGSVDDANFSVVEEIRGTKLRKSLQFQVLSDRHGTTEDESVIVRISQVNLVCHHHLLHDKTFTESFRVIVLHVSRVASCLEIHLHLCRCTH